MGSRGRKRKETKRWTRQRATNSIQTLPHSSSSANHRKNKSKYQKHITPYHNKLWERSVESRGNTGHEDEGGPLRAAVTIFCASFSACNRREMPSSDCMICSLTTMKQRWRRRARRRGKDGEKDDQKKSKEEAIGKFLLRRIGFSLSSQESNDSASRAL